MSDSALRDAWVAMPPEDVLRQFMPAGSDYALGFLPAMARLIMARPRIGPAFGTLFDTIMFQAPARPRRRGRC